MLSVAYLTDIILSILKRACIERTIPALGMCSLNSNIMAS